MLISWNMIEFSNKRKQTNDAQKNMDELKNHQAK
jgi:hypothetical protein